jgi:Cu(I)/Ag(I) efflux system membrane protein CusA/SilA
MLATGIKSPLGIKVSGNDLAGIDRATQAIEHAVKEVPGVSSALAERVSGGRYIDVAIDRLAASRVGLNVSDIQSVVSSAIGGETIGETVEGRRRFPISVRYPRELRDSPEKLKSLPVVTEGGAQIALGSVAAVTIADGPPMLRSENARLAGWVYVDIRGRDLASVVDDAKRAVASAVKAEPGISIGWSGQFEFLERAKQRLAIVIPVTLAIIFVLLYLTFRRLDEAAIIMATLPLALIGGFWYVYLLGHNLSVATAVGFIALGGLAAEFGVVMLIYLKNACEHGGHASLLEAIDHGAVRRVRPKAMTVAVIVAGLAPIMWSEGTGAEVMQRIAAPMIGGMITAPLLSLFVLPAAYLLLRGREFRSSTPSQMQTRSKGAR